MVDPTSTARALAAIAQAIARSVGGRRQDPQGATSARDHVAVLRDDRSTLRQRAAALERLVLAADASIESKMTETAFLLFRIRMKSDLSPGQRMAVVKGALMLSQSRVRGGWVEELRAEYDGFTAKALQPDWTWVGLEPARVENLLAEARGGAGLPAFETTRSAARPPSARDPLPTLSTSSLKITKLSVSGFRSVPGSVDVSAVNAHGRPVSLIISGDNGTGKSSLVSAIEFAAQGTIGRAVPGSSSSAFTPVSLRATEDQATVGVLFDDGSAAVRKVDRDGTVSGSPRLPDFAMTPISLQRADLIKFLETSPDVRAQLFVGMLGTDSTDPALRDAEQQLLQARARRDQVRQEVSGSLPTDSTGRLSLPQRLSQVYLSGLTQREWEARRGALPPAYRATVNPLRESEDAASTAKRAMAEIAQQANLGHPHQVARLARIVGDLTEPMTRSVKSITGYQHFEQIEVQIGRPALGVTMRVHLADGVTVRPERFFSEGVQDLIAILFFLEIAHAAAERGQAKVLILDDAIQSVDAGVRVRLMEYIATRFRGWQLFITCHDKLWREQVRSVLRGAGHPFAEVEIRTWSYDDGPQLLHSASAGDPSAALRQHVGTSSPSVVAGQAGRLLEAICDRLSWTLPVAVLRTRTDRYDLGALWPPLLKKLRGSSIADLLEPVARSLYLRNMLGAHYNEFAESVSDQEADDFGRAVLSLWDSVWCSNCGQWIELHSEGKCGCRCGSVSLTF
jgi:AAA domain